MTPAGPVLATRAVPGDPWWEQQLMQSLRNRDAVRLCWLLTLAEADTVNPGPDVFAVARAKQ